MKKEQITIKQVINTLLRNWKETRQLTLDWIKKLTLAQLNQKLPRPGLNSFAKHIYEMGEIQKICIAALKEENLDLTAANKLTFESCKLVAKTKGELTDFLNRCDKEFYKTLKNIDDWDKVVSIFGEKRSRYGIIELMIIHETLHHGQFIAFGYMESIEFPKSWIDAWALPPK